MKSSAAHLNHTTRQLTTNKRGFMKKYHFSARSGVIAFILISLVAFAGFSTVMIQRTQASKTSAPAVQPLVIGTCDVATAGLPVEIESTGGTITPTAYASVGAAFAAINAGTHTGTINVEICFDSNEGTTPATLNSGDATPASYTSVSIRPLADGRTVSGNPVTGFGVIQLNGADNVTLDGDNPNTASTNRNLTISNTTTATVIANSAVRIATSTAVTSADNDIIRNCNLLGNVTGGNSSLITAATTSSNSSFGIYVGGNGGATAVGAPTAITSVTAQTAPSGTTVNNLLIDNNFVNQAARGIVFNGAVATVSNGITISNNTIGATGAPTPANPPFTAPATTVYTKGIWVAGTSAVNVTGNTINNILSYISTTTTTIEMVSPVISPTISNNLISNVANNGTVNIAKAILVSNATGVYTISGNSITNVQTLAGASGTDAIECTSTTTNGVIEKNRITKVHSRSTGTFGAYGINVTAGTGINIRNNFVSDINMDMTGGAAFSTQFSVHGIRLAGGTGHKVYHNSVNLFGALFGTPTTTILTSAFTPTATTITGLDVRNNIFANTMTGGTTSIAHVSMFLPSSATVAFNLTNNNNAYYTGSTAGVHGVAHVGTTYTAVPAGPATYAGLYTAPNFNAGATTPNTNFRAYTSILSAAGTNDNASFATTNPAPFTSPTDLHIPNGTVTLLESGGAAGTGVTVDIDNETRNATTPDIGADEFTGVLPPANDIAATAIIVPAPGSLIATGNTPTPQASFTNVGIAAQSGVMVQFTITGPGGYTYTDTQTIANITPGQTLTVTFAAAPTLTTVGTYNTTATILTADANAANNTQMGTFTVAAPVSGAVSVGTGGTYTSLTNPGGAFDAINGLGATSNVTLNITTDLTSETGAVSLNPVAGGFTVLIQPSGNRIISGSSATALINLNGADSVTIDGLGNPTFNEQPDGGNSLLIRNTGAGTVIRLINDASNNIIQNAVIEGGSSSANIFLSTGTTTGNDNNLISGNIVRDRTDGVGVPFNVIGSVGTSAAIANSGNTITGNDLINFTQAGVLVNPGNESWTITGNDISSTANRATVQLGIFMTSAGTNVVSDNLIHDLRTSFAGGTGVNTAGMLFTDARATTVSRNRIYNFAAVTGGTGRIVGVEFDGASGTAASVTLVNNMVSLVTQVATNQSVFGLFDFGFGGNTFTADHNSIYIGGASSGTAASWALVRGTSAPTTYTARNNIAFNNRTGGGANHFAGGDQSANTGTFVSNGNFFAGTGATTAANFMDYGTSGTGTAVSFPTWQAGPPARDANSIAGVASTFDPAMFFVNANAGDLHLLATATPVLDAGQPLPSVTTDFDNQPRSATTPDIGADEYIVVPGVLELSSATYTVGEAAGTVTITVNRTGGTDGAVAVNYSLTNGTATGGAACGAGVDFVNTGGTVNFINGQGSNTFTVTICNDAIFEGNETFNVTLSGATGGATIGTQASAVVTITDDEVAMPGTVQFDMATYTVGEAAGTATITVTRTGGSDGTVTVDAATVAGGTATGGATCGGTVDYVTTTSTLTFGPGVTSQSFNITICSDALNETNETVNLALSNATGGATIGTQSTAVLTITDDDAVPSIAITSPSPLPEGNAGTTPFTFNVNLSAASGQTITVHYQTADGTATVANNDYVAIPDTTLTFNPGETSKPITVNVNGDLNVEPNETFFVNLSLPTNATIGTAQGTGTIQNDDNVLPVITVSDARVLEGDSGQSVAQFTLTLTGAQQGLASVHYSTSNGTAVASPSPAPGDDYIARPDTVIAFNPLDESGDGNALTATVNVFVNGDTIKEANETFYLNLSMPVNATIADAQGVGIIIDDDRSYTADVDDDRRSDFVVFRPSEGVWYTLQSTNGFTNYRFFGINGDRPVPGDYDGDGAMDLAVFRPSTAAWYIEQSSNFGFIQVQWGLSTDIPVQGDYDGDSKTDIGVFRNGAWYIRKSSDNTLLGVNFGSAGDRPVQGDYDGDNKTDFAVFRNGDWYVLRSSDGGVTSATWGLGTDRLVPADYDGDGKFDFAVFRNGVWHILQTLTGTGRSVAWGLSTDLPVQADYDGDGSADIAVFRDGDWYIINSSNNTVSTQHWGQAGDIPAASGYLPPQ